MDLLGRARIAALQAAIAGLEAELVRQRRQAQALLEHGRHQADLLSSFFGAELSENARLARVLLADLPLPLLAGWDELQWAGWSPGETIEAPRLRVGELVEPGLALPAFLPFIGRARTVVLRTDELTAERGLALLQS